MKSHKCFSTPEFAILGILQVGKLCSSDEVLYPLMSNIEPHKTLLTTRTASNILLIVIEIAVLSRAMVINAFLAPQGYSVDLRFARQGCQLTNHQNDSISSGFKTLRTWLALCQRTKGRSPGCKENASGLAGRWPWRGIPNTSMGIIAFDLLQSFYRAILCAQPLDPSSS